MRGVVMIGIAVILLAPATASSSSASNAGGVILFAPAHLPAATVGVRYQAVIRVTRNGHNPANGEDFPGYTVDCYGADQAGGFLDDCKNLPRGLRFARASAEICPPAKAACVVLLGTPRLAGRYTFRVSAPDVNSIGVRGVVRKYTVIVRLP
jgi:hypothetical protein